MSKPDGGPAFPFRKTYLGLDEQTEFSGMTLRDWFAGMALQGMNASPELMQAITKSHTDLYDGSAFQKMAIKAYEQADVMIAEREKR